MHNLTSEPDLLSAADEVVLPNVAARHQVTLVTGPFGIGKSTILASLLADESKKRDLDRPFALIWISFEEVCNPVGSMNTRRSTGLDHLTYFDGMQVPYVERMDQVHQIIRSKRPSIAIIDSLDSMLTRSGETEMNARSPEWIAFCVGLRTTAEQSDSAIVAVHHLSGSPANLRGGGHIAKCADNWLDVCRVTSDPLSRRLQNRGREFSTSFTVTMVDGALRVSQVEQND